MPVDLLDQPLESRHDPPRATGLCGLGISGHKMGAPLSWINLPVMTIR